MVDRMVRFYQLSLPPLSAMSKIGGRRKMTRKNGKAKGPLTVYLAAADAGRPIYPMTFRR